MYPNFSPIRLTIVDFLGVFLPGIVWTILLFTLWGMLDKSQGFPLDNNPLTVAWFLATNKSDKFGAVFYVGLTLLSVLLGYLDMAASTILPEYASHLLCKIAPLNKNNRKIKYYLFPYTEYFRKKSYYGKLVNLVKSELNLSSFDSLHEFATYHPFETCKRILKIRQSPLWEDAQYREAQVRMLASLFVASLFNLGLAVGNTGFFNSTFCIIAIILIFLQFGLNDEIKELVKMLIVIIIVPFAIITGHLWFFISLIITIILANTFRYRRFREVEDVYISTLLVLIKK